MSMNVLQYSCVFSYDSLSGSGHKGLTSEDTMTEYQVSDLKCFRRL